MIARLDLLRRFAEFSNEYPWQWQPAGVEAFFDALRSCDRPIAVSTARNYQNTLRMFCDYIIDARYGWVTECLDRVGACATTSPRGRGRGAARRSRAVDVCHYSAAL